MLKDARVIPTIPVSNLEKAKSFYENVLGLKSGRDNLGGELYECGEGSAVLVYQSAGAGTSEGTYASWNVENLDEVMEDLRSKGVEFEEYDLPGLKTTDGVAEHGGMRSAWFKDPDGNILALAEEG